MLLCPLPLTAVEVAAGPRGGHGICSCPQTTVVRNTTDFDAPCLLNMSEKSHRISVIQRVNL